MLHRGIVADAADEHAELAHAFLGGDVAGGIALIDHHHAGGIAQDVPGVVGVEGALELQIDGEGVAHEHRHTDAGDGQLDVRIQHLVRLLPHLGFLVRIAVVLEGADERDDVEGDLFGELHRLRRAEDEHALGLVPELVHALLARAGHRLIGRDHGPLDSRLVMQGLQRHHQLGGGAVRVGDDVLDVGPGHGIRVHLRNDQGHVRVLAPGGRIVDHDGARRADALGPFPRHRPAGRHQHHIHLGEVEGLQVDAFQHPVPIGDLLAHGLARGHGVNFAHGELQFLEDVHHFPAHIARGADDRDAVAHVQAPDREGGERLDP